MYMHIIIYIYVYVCRFIFCDSEILFITARFTSLGAARKPLDIGPSYPITLTQPTSCRKTSHGSCPPGISSTLNLE